MLRGWYVITRSSDLQASPQSAIVAGERLLLLKTTAGVRVFSAVCPHRGADLGLVGVLEGTELIRCGFHGLRIGLGGATLQKRCVPELQSTMIGDLVLARLGNGPECSFAAKAAELSGTHRFSDTACVRIRTPHSWVIENAFDELHFGPVHDVSKVRPFSIEREANGTLSASSRFQVPPSRWQRARPGASAIDVPFRATAYSPGLVVTRMGGDRPYLVMTAATPSANDECLVHLTIGVPNDSLGVTEADLNYLLAQGVAGLEKDRVIWESLTPNTANFEPTEGAVRAFREFCSTFVNASAG